MTIRGARAPWRSSERVLLVGGHVYSSAHPFSTALLIDGDTIAWVGEDSAAEVYRDAADRIVHLEGAFVAPGFVDAHVHATSSGLLLTGLDLTAARSRDEVLHLVSAECRARPEGVIIGHGWDETSWADPTPPTRGELDSAANGRAVYLSRIDVHSALVSTALLDLVPDAAGAPGWHDAGPVARQAHHLLRKAAYRGISPERREEAQRAVRQHAAATGIVALHEMAGPGISSESDLDAFLTLSDGTPGPLGVGYWGELASAGGLEVASGLGVVGAAGDLFVDGAIGSRTACLHEPYRDDPTSRGAAYLDPEEIASHVSACTLAGLQGGFHVIGDAAAAAVTEGLRRAAAHVGADAIRRAGHRIEHAEMLSDDDIAILAEYSVTASVQPMFDALWGGSGGMYETRLGRNRADTMNRFADLMSAGAPLAFSSDSPVTPIGPWAAVRAAINHTTPDQRISGRAAFAAHTRGGWRAAGDPHAGVITPGAPAHLALWQSDEFEVHAPDTRLSGWSTDPRSGTPALPLLSDDVALPTCIATLVAGTPVFSSDALTW